MNLFVYVFMCVCRYIYVYVCVYIYIYIYMYVCMYVCMYVYIYTHTHKHTHTYTHTYCACFLQDLTKWAKHTDMKIHEFHLHSKTTRVLSPCVQSYMHTHTYVRLCVCSLQDLVMSNTCKNDDAVFNEFMYLCVCVCVYVCMYVCVCLRLYIHIYTYTCTLVRVLLARFDIMSNTCRNDDARISPAFKNDQDAFSLRAFYKRLDFILTFHGCFLLNYVEHLLLLLRFIHREKKWIMAGADAPDMATAGCFTYVDVIQNAAHYSNSWCMVAAIWRNFGPVQATCYSPPWFFPR